MRKIVNQITGRLNLRIIVLTSFVCIISLLAIIFFYKGSILSVYSEDLPRQFELSGGQMEVSYHLSTTFLLSLVPYLAGELFLFLFVCRLAAKIGSIKRQSHLKREEGLIASESGASTVVEFLLIFPLLLMTIFVLLQIALIVHAKFVVNYAAFCAVRSAIVTIPARIRSNRNLEGRNQISTGNPDSPKMKIIRRAAALPCLAISPRWSASVGLSTQTGFNVSILLPLAKLQLLGIGLPGGRNTLEEVTARAHYAYDKKNTKVDVSFSGSQPQDHTPITVKVTHRYFLTVPFADRLFGTNYWGSIGGFGIGAKWYIPITEEYTLLNEGEPIYPDSQREKFRASDIEDEIY